MSKKYLIFQTYSTRLQAEEASDILLKKGIDNIVIEDGVSVDSNFVGVRFENKFSVKMEGDDFDKARKILQDAVVINLNEIDENYMLLHFNDNELLEVIAKPDEWGEYNYQLAKVLLEQRGVEEHTKAVQQIYDKHIDKLTEQRKLHFLSIIISLLFSVFSICLIFDIKLVVLTPILRPGFFLINVLFCAAIVFLKKTLPNGSREFVFNEGSRKMGKFLLALSLSSLLILFFYFLTLSLP